MIVELGGQWVIVLGYWCESNRRRSCVWRGWRYFSHLWRKRALIVPQHALHHSSRYFYSHVAFYRVSQQVWDRLDVIFWSSKVCKRRLRIFRKNVFCSIKLLFEPFLWTAKLKMEFLSNFSPIVLCSNLFSKLFEIGEKLLKNPFSFFAVHKKGWKSNFLEQNTNFFL